MKSLRITGGAGKIEHTTRWARQITYRLHQITSLYMRLFGSDSELNGLQTHAKVLKPAHMRAIS